MLLSFSPPIRMHVVVALTSMQLWIIYIYCLCACIYILRTNNICIVHTKFVSGTTFYVMSSERPFVRNKSHLNSKKQIPGFPALFSSILPKIRKNSYPIWYFQGGKMNIVAINPYVIRSIIGLCTRNYFHSRWKRYWENLYFQNWRYNFAYYRNRSNKYLRNTSWLDFAINIVQWMTRATHDPNILDNILQITFTISTLISDVYVFFVRSFR